MFAAHCVARDSRLGDPGNSCELEKTGTAERWRISASRPRVRGIDNHKLGAQKNAPVSRGVFAIVGCRCRPKPNRAYAAALAAEPSTTCGAAALVVAIGMLRGFLASGISRTRST